MANKVYIAAETSVIFGSEVGDDVAWSNENISSGAGRSSAMYDPGAFPRSLLWDILFYTQAQATPTLGNTVRVYLQQSQASSAHPVGPSTDAAISAESALVNCGAPILHCGVTAASANTEFAKRAAVSIWSRMFGLSLWNAMGSSITNDGAETKAVCTPMPPELQ